MCDLKPSEFDETLRAVKEVPTNLEHPCFRYLSSENLSFSARSSDTFGTTLVANTRISPGSLLFNLPTEFMITYDMVCKTPLSKIIDDVSHSYNVSISPEALTWLNMVVWLVQDENELFQSEYFRALSAVPPNGSSWPQYLQDALMGSNVHAVLDATGVNDETIGNVSAVENTLTLLDCIRNILNQQNGNERYQDPPSLLALQYLCERPSIFTFESISWARGHFLSRRFPDPRKKIEKAGGSKHAGDHFLLGYGGKYSVFIPVLDLMNHSPVKDNTCTVELLTEGLEVRSGEIALEVGDELFYCYGENLSNEVLLQGYGFCLPDNPSDKISLKITTNSTGEASETFSMGRGGVSAIPPEMWKAIAGVTGDDDQELEIGSGDLERLLEYMASKLGLLTGKGEVAKVKEDGSNINELDQLRSSFIDIYKKGQREILEELIQDIIVMLGHEI